LTISVLFKLQPVPIGITYVPDPVFFKHPGAYGSMLTFTALNFARIGSGENAYIILG
jgi:hypothetical protein